MKLPGGFGALPAALVVMLVIVNAASVYSEANDPVLSVDLQLSRPRTNGNHSRCRFCDNVRSRLAEKEEGGKVTGMSPTKLAETMVNGLEAARLLRQVLKTGIEGRKERKGNGIGGPIKIARSMINSRLRSVISPKMAKTGPGEGPGMDEATYELPMVVTRLDDETSSSRQGGIVDGGKEETKDQETGEDFLKAEPKALIIAPCPVDQRSDSHGHCRPVLS